jgi:hypothetical protein
MKIPPLLPFKKEDEEEFMDSFQIHISIVVELA